ncbi:MAG: hypothetical protein BGN97_04930 [Microbacterium sp. 69-10]|nr:MAG: hypothetical protein BGN97_04930 [Microbacterium sp. 69-10]
MSASMPSQRSSTTHPSSTSSTTMNSASHDPMRERMRQEVVDGGIVEDLHRVADPREPPEAARP